MSFYPRITIFSNRSKRDSKFLLFIFYVIINELLFLKEDNRLKLKKLIGFLVCFSFLLAPSLFKIIAEETKSNSLFASEPLKIELISEQDSISPEKAFKVGLVLNIQQGYHVYWKNPGEFGFPLNITWQLPEGFSVSNTEWTNPYVYSEQMTIFAYEKEAMIIATIIPSKDVPLNEKVPIGVKVNWLACADDCVSGSSSEEIKLLVKEESGKDNLLFKEAEKNAAYSFPKYVEGSVKVSLKEEKKLVFQIPHKLAMNFDKVLFVPEKGNVELINFSSSQEISKNSEETLLIVQTKHNSLSNLNIIKGLLLFQNEKGTTVSSILINESLLQTPNNIAIKASPVSTSTLFSFAFLTIMGLAFLGGLALNIMPCVLPLITLKIYSLIKAANEKKSLLFKHGFCFAFGVISCFWLLAIIAFFMKFFGHNVGWGFQLQEPIFVSTLTIIFFLFALSSLGVFQIGSIFLNFGNKLQTKEVVNKSQITLLLGSFLNGLLATLVTTPCTGPFLGSVLGLVMSFSLIKQFLIFTTMGLGMSSPYLIFSVFPKLISFLPKPGNWMVVFKQIMGFIMMLTVLWLTWIFVSETSVKGLFYLLFSLLLASFAAWLLGKWGSPVVTKIKRRVVSLLAGILVMGSLTIGTYASKQVGDASQHLTKGSSWEIFSAERLAQLRAEGKSVFVDFTAKWCLTCQANKSVLHDEELEEFFNTHGIIKMIADWTRKDPEISSELSKLGRASVPAYVFYPEGNKEPILLPQTLSFKIIEKEIGVFFFDQNECN